MTSGYSSKMFASPGMASSFASPPGTGFSSQQHSATGVGSAIISPSSSGLGPGLASIGGSGGSPVFQSPSGNRFPVGGGAVVFTPHSNASPITGAPSAVSSVVSPYSYVGGSASSFVQSPPPVGGGTGMIYSPPAFSSTMAPNVPGHPNVGVSPITHGYGPPPQYANVQPYMYGARAMTMAGAGAGHTYHQSLYQNHYQGSPYFGHNSPRDEIVEPMHCSPVGHLHPAGSPQYQQQLQRSPGNNPPRPQPLPAYLTGIDLVASVPPRPRRVFDRSPSTSPPTAAGSGGRSPQSKSPNWTQQDGTQAAAAGFGIHSSQGQAEGGNALSGLFTKRAQGQGPSRQLRFNESHSVPTAEEKEKAKRTGPPIRGFGTSEEVSNFLNSPLLSDNYEIVPGAAIAQEAILKAGADTPLAESNWVTVFGFPAAAASFIYTHFAQYGSISQFKCNPGGNWMHIQYSSRIDARRALACNGKVLGGSIMVGVISSPKEVIEMYEKPLREAQSNRESSSSTNEPSRQFSSSLKAPLQERNSDSTNTTEGSGKLRNIRPLAGSSQLTSPVASAVDRPSNKEPSFHSRSSNQNENVPLPTASTDILTKAMEYMFGW